MQYDIYYFKTSSEQNTYSNSDHKVTLEFDSLDQAEEVVKGFIKTSEYNEALIYLVLSSVIVNDQADIRSHKKEDNKKKLGFLS